MVREYQKFSCGPDESMEEFKNRVGAAMKNMTRQTFDARPLPQEPEILTSAITPSLQDDAELWRGTCPVCRPIVRDLRIFCTPQQTTRPDQNVFIQWNIVFSELASMLNTNEPLKADMDMSAKNNEQNNMQDAEERDDAPITEQRTTPNAIEYSDSDRNLEDKNETNEGQLCAFCAYFACLMFDDPAYTFFTTVQGTGNFELDCCCMDSVAESKRVGTARRKLIAYADKYGQDAGIKFLIRPIDYHPDEGGFGKLRFQAYTRSPSIPDGDLINILGLRRECVLEVYAVPGQMSGGMPALRYWPISTNPEEWLGYGKLWASECISNHKDCQSPVQGPLPSRVIEILDGENVRLVSGTDKANEFYITLSYCWGGPQEFSLTTDTMSEKEKGFNVSCLPATLKDAIKVAQAFDVKYIWIDSLCIIQDSAADKNKELPRMAGYYRNSYLTISASTGKCTEPFLYSQGLCAKHPDNMFPKDLVLLNLLVSSTYEAKPKDDGTDSGSGTQYTKHALDYLFVRKEHPYFLSLEPISTRGWTFQERVLSPRILCFGGRVVWQCHTNQSSAGGVTYWDEDAPNIDHRTLGRVLFGSRSEKGPEKSSGSIQSSKKEQYSLWYKAVEEYTRRKLSVTSDKLPAISALAQVFQDLTQDEYLAGIWRGDLLRGLMWSTYPTLALSRPSLWRAPSWSWASHDNEVSYKKLPPPNSIPIARVVTAKAVPLSIDTPLGEIGSGVLEIEGPVLVTENKVTIFLMQKENEVPKIEDTANSRYQFMHRAVSDGSTVDPGCRDWEPPTGHILLVLLATGVEAHPNRTAEAGPSSNTGRVSDADVSSTLVDSNEPDSSYRLAETDHSTGATESQHNQSEDVEAVHDEGSIMDSGTETSSAAKSGPVPEFTGYALSGLVLGPVHDAGSKELKYERLAVFTSLATSDYRDLEKLKRTVVIV